jgi:aspartate racemase
MSWESSAHYYRLINQETARRLGGLHSAELILHSVDFAPIEAMQRAGEWEKSGERLGEIARGLAGQGAAVIGLATNTMHIVADRVTEGLGAEFVHIADPTAEALVEDGYETAGLLGTRFTLEKPFYRERLAARGLTVLVPEVGVTNLNGIIYEELCKGIVTEASRRTYVAAIEQLAARGAEAVILGCTEIGMLIDDAVSPLPVFDTTALHARALVAAALEE